MNMKINSPETVYMYSMLIVNHQRQAYDTGDCLHQAVNFHGSNFLLIHGTADDNVHYTNAARLASALVEEAVQFRMHAYTGTYMLQCLIKLIVSHKHMAVTWYHEIS